MSSVLFSLILVWVLEIRFVDEQLIKDRLVIGLDPEIINFGRFFGIILREKTVSQSKLIVITSAKEVMILPAFVVISLLVTRITQL